MVGEFTMEMQSRARNVLVENHFNGLWWIWNEWTTLSFYTNGIKRNEILFSILHSTMLWIPKKGALMFIFGHTKLGYFHMVKNIFLVCYPFIEPYIYLCLFSSNRIGLFTFALRHLYVHLFFTHSNTILKLSIRLCM